MDFIKKNLRAIVVALLAVGVVVAVSATNDTNTNGDNQEAASEVVENQSGDEQGSSEGDAETSADDSENQDVSTPSQGEQVEKSGTDYSASAQTGDSQTKLVRRILAQYADEQDQTLSAEQQLYVETRIVRNDLETTDYINAGDVVKVSEDTLKTRFEEAKNLSEASLALWAQYL